MRTCDCVLEVCGLTLNTTRSPIHNVITHHIPKFVQSHHSLLVLCDDFLPTSVLLSSLLYSTPIIPNCKCHLSYLGLDSLTFEQLPL
jgi:hypothetical protein